MEEFLDKGKGLLQMNQGECEPERPPLTIEHFPSSLLLSRPLKKTNISGGTTEKPPIVFSHYLDIKRHNRVLQKEL
jgi:hypothetical protein